MRERLCRARAAACPTGRRSTTLGELDAFLAAHGGRAVVKTPRGGYDGKGVRVVRSAAEVADWFAALAEDAPRRRPARRGARRLPARARAAGRPPPVRRGRRLARSSRRVQRGGVCAEVIAPAPRSAGRLADVAADVAIAIAEGLGVTGRARGRAVRDDRRAPPRQRARDAPAQQRALDDGRRRRPASSSSTCAPCSTCRSAAPAATRDVVGHGQRPRRARRGDARPTATPRRWPATRPSRCTTTARRRGPAARSGTSRRPATTSTTSCTRRGPRRRSSRTDEVLGRGSRHSTGDSHVALLARRGCGDLPAPGSTLDQVTETNTSPLVGVVMGSDSAICTSFSYVRLDVILMTGSVDDPDEKLVRAIRSARSSSRSRSTARCSGRWWSAASSCAGGAKIIART